MTFSPFLRYTRLMKKTESGKALGLHIVAVLKPVHKLLDTPSIGEWSLCLLWNLGSLTTYNSGNDAILFPRANPEKLSSSTTLRMLPLELSHQVAWKPKQPAERSTWREPWLPVLAKLSAQVIGSMWMDHLSAQVSSASWLCTERSWAFSMELCPRCRSKSKRKDYCYFKPLF